MSEIIILLGYQISSTLNDDFESPLSPPILLVSLFLLRSGDRDHQQKQMEAGDNHEALSSDRERFYIKGLPLILICLAESSEIHGSRPSTVVA